MPEADLSASRRCVRCAVCLPHCPTYATAVDEAESPRGRLALMDGYARGLLEADEAFWGHLDRCLGCRLCEAVCPAEVPYGALLDRIRAVERGQGRRAPRLHRGLRFVAGRPWALALLARTLRPAAAFGARPLRRILPSSLRPLIDLIPHPLPHPWRPPAGVALRPAHEGEVALFLGCYARLLRPEPLRATLRVLADLGIRTVIPPRQTCCGALARHMGEDEEAERLAAHNRQALAGARTVLVLDTGCLGSLRSALVDGNGTASAPPEIVEASSFLDRVLPARLPQTRVPMPLLVHTPCTQRSLAAGPAPVHRVLARLGLEAQPWGQGAGCCGAAGTHGFLYPEGSAALLDRVFTPPPPEGAGIVTCNIGCALTLGARLDREKHTGKIFHPSEILDLFWDRSPGATASVTERSQE